MNPITLIRTDLIQSRLTGILHPLLGLALLFLTTSCSTFERRWRESDQSPINHGSSPAGRWSGTWSSHMNGHQGELRCVLHMVSGGGYEADFHARFWKFFSWRYRLPVQVHTAKEHWVVEGKSDLGWLFGGQYSACGIIQENAFTAHYTNRYDHGIMELTRQ